MPTGIAGEMLRTETIVVVVPRGFRFPRVGGLAELADQSWIVNPPGCNGRRALQGAFDKAGLRLNIALETSGTGLQFALIEGGRGIGAFLSSVVKASNFRNSISIIRPADFHPRLSIWTAYHPNSPRLTQPIRALSEALKNRDGVSG